MLWFEIKTLPAGRVLRNYASVSKLNAKEAWLRNRERSVSGNTSLSVFLPYFCQIDQSLEMPQTSNNDYFQLIYLSPSFTSVDEIVRQLFCPFPQVGFKKKDIAKCKINCFVLVRSRLPSCQPFGATAYLDCSVKKTTDDPGLSWNVS